MIVGTSASAPVFAATIALLNDVQLGDRKLPVGFVNPLLYLTAKAGFNDVRLGRDPGCGTLGFNVRVFVFFCLG